MNRLNRLTLRGALISSVSLLTLGFILALWGLQPGAAYAQKKGPPSELYSTGPFMLHDGERVLVGLLLPYIEQPGSMASFRILDSSGKELYETKPGPPVNTNQGSMFSSFFDITYRPPSATNNGGMFEVRESALGKVIAILPSTDGILIGLLLPAVQRNGKIAAPLAASMQSFNANGGTITHSSFFDVFTE